MLKVPLTDPMSGCFMMTRDYYMSARPRLAGVGFKILLDVAASSKIKPRFGEIKAALRQRQGGESKLDLRVVLDLAALLVEKATGGVMKARFVLFAAVGMSGVFVSFVVLALFRLFVGRTLDIFSHAQIAAIAIAMTWNFFVNNLVTFRDQRLKGAGIIMGLLGFYLACLPGAVLNWWLGIVLKEHHVPFVVAGTIPAFLIGILNYFLAKILSWRKPKKAEAGVGPQAKSPRKAGDVGLPVTTVVVVVMMTVVAVVPAIAAVIAVAAAIVAGHRPGPGHRRRHGCRSRCCRSRRCTNSRRSTWCCSWRFASR